MTLSMEEFDAILMDAKPDLEFEVDIPPEMMQAFTSAGSIAPRVSRREALQVPAVMRARNLICSTLARLPVHVRDKEREIATNWTFLDQIDPDVANVVTYSQTYEDLMFEGTAWWRIIATDYRGFPSYAEHIATNRVFISGHDLPELNGTMPIPGVPSQVFIDGKPVRDEDVIRFDSPNPPLLVHAARAIRACLQLDQAAAMYANEPIPLGYFTPKEGTRVREDDQSIQQMLDKWDVARRSRAWAFIGGQVDLKELGFNAEQIQLADQRQHAVLEIARAAGVDPEDLGVSTTSRTYQNSEQRRLDLLDFTLSHYVAALEQRLSMRDVIPRGYQTKVSFDGFLRADTKTRMETYAIGKPLGAYTQDEIRELEDRPDLTPAERAATQPVSIPQQNGQSNGQLQEAR